MNKTNLFKILLLIQTVGLLIYTLIAFQNEGANLFNVFIKNIAAFSWSGQFNLDFLSYLILSGLWIMWRNKFTVKSILIGLIASVLGIVFFALYLLWLTNKEDGDLKRVLIGDR
ncbi:MAG: hypothetical protein MH132_05090 [Hydrotalea sp.]|nr:hypothetical protein [Hydrotalea sp.]